MSADAPQAPQRSSAPTEGPLDPPTERVHPLPPAAGLTEVPDPAPAPAAAGVGGKVGRGLAWSMLNTVVLRLGIFLSGIIMARLLTTADYGVFALAVTALTVLQAFNELGVSLALVRWERDVREFAGTAMTIAIANSALLYAAVWALTPKYCELMGSPEAVTVVRVLCAAVLVDGIAVVPATILNREFLQRTRFFCDAASFVVVTGLTITLGASGAGAISFSVGQLSGSIVSMTCYLLLCPVRVRPGWDRATARELIRFGLPLAAASVLTLSVTQIDKIIVGGFTDAAALGLYLMVFNQSSLPLQIFSEAGRRVSLAGFARMADNKPQLELAVARGVGLMVAAALPVCALLACYSAPMLHAVYGDQWVPGAQALRFLAILGLARILLFIGYDLLVALDGNRVLIWLQGLWLVVTVGGLFAGVLLDGIRGAAIAQAAVTALIVLPVFGAVVVRRGIRLAPALRACGRPVLGGALVVASSFLVRAVFENSWLQLLVGGLVAVVVYLPVVYPMRSMLPGRSGAAA
ncbi:oligosaccharide flippase family protein [Actinokineospora auranticolor]|uniref:O-antigen/teichoic acid export membrane protein n=1 Tax=Actinokineospora auranticolor TaxID=155976 RepID=A0A2S6GH17_9PSEU|nr:oligosaccharide flippase family protein [Actinokineospora auranticolor]PPK64517.1 O-antigen/teichoic acid export membrane protein [Actinokineospora auranticolor]